MKGLEVDPQMQKQLRKSKMAAISAAKGKGKGGGAGKNKGRRKDGEDKAKGDVSDKKPLPKAKAKAKAKGAPAESRIGKAAKLKSPKSPGNRKPGAARGRAGGDDEDGGEPEGRPLGCPKCRYSRTGCSNCKNPNYRPRRARPAKI